ncbi:MAG: nucleoside-triphosphatase [Bacteroidetes bacterium]|nr:nucleoside-triphosphatase [Bacteroidota bacterium]
MDNRNKINHVWLKSTVVGSLWASSEIILGSFLHNVQAPFSGTILSSIGVILLVASDRFWQTKGIIWRAGIICAIMKTISPSADIFGPMISIAAEAFLLEAIVRIFGSNYFGYLIGGGLAVSWSLFYKIFGSIIVYGFNIVELYSKLYQFAAKQINFKLTNPWTLVLVLFFIYLILGAIAGVFGKFVGDKAKSDIEKKFSSSINIHPIIEFTSAKNYQKFSFSWLVLHILAIISGLIALNILPLWVSTILILCYVGVCLMQYQHNLKRLKKPKFWILLISITLLAGLLLSSLRSNVHGVNWSGLSVGIAINVRAFLMIFGFSSLSIELRNPKIEHWFKQKGMRQFSQSLEVAFKILPFMAANVSEEKMIFKKPLIASSNLILKANYWLERIEENSYGLPIVFIVTGERGSGKTTLLSQTLLKLKSEKINTSGILAPGFWTDNRRSAFDIVDIQSEDRTKLCTIEPSQSRVRIGQFNFLSEGISLGNKALSTDKVSESDVCIIDEIGFLELKGEGWSNRLNELIKNYKKILVLVVRNELVDDVCKKWSIYSPIIFDCREKDSDNLSSAIYHHLILLSDKSSINI